ncbi:unnamed protein product, partial [Mesorhabditis spiculigera]
MPLFNKRPWEKIPIPEGLRSDERVYYCDATGEIFTTYDELFDRLMELNSTVWTCEYTKRSNLTFFEAQDSEQEAMKMLGNFPEHLEVAILYLVDKFSCRGRFEEMLNDIYFFLKDRFVVGEEVTISDGKKPAKIVSVTADTSDFKEPEGKVKETCAPAPESYSYVVKVDSRDGTSHEKTVNYVMISRNKRMLARATLRVFLQNTCKVRNQEGERYYVKEKYREQHHLSDVKWEQVFGGPLPIFPKTPMRFRGRGRSKGGEEKMEGDDDEVASDTEKKPAKEKHKHRKSKDKEHKSPRESRSPKKPLTEKKKAQIAAQQDELRITFEKAKRLSVDRLDKWQQSEKLLSKKDLDALNEAIKAARRNERESNQKKKAAAQTWARKRDDLECDDLKPFPTLPKLPLPDWMSEEMFTKAVDVYQFFNSFADILPIKEKKNSSKVTLQDVFIALRCRDPRSSTYSMLMEILLKARQDVCDEEEGDEVDFSRRDEIPVEVNPDHEHPEFGDDLRAVTKYHEEIRYTLGSSVRNLYTDWLSLTEVLRLLLLTSGYVTRSGKHRHRLFQRGSIHFYDDPGFIYRKENPELLEKLETGTVFDLEPEERLDLMHLIMRQLLTYAKFRNLASEKCEDVVAQRREYKKMRCWDATQENEAKDARLIREMHAEGQDVKIPNPSKETLKLKPMLRAAQDGRRHDKAELDKVNFDVYRNPMRVK